MELLQHSEPPTPLKPRKKRVKRLKTAKDVAGFIAACIADTVGGGDENKNYKLCMMACMMLKAIEVSDLEERVIQLERTVNGEHTPGTGRSY